MAKEKVVIPLALTPLQVMVLVGQLQLSLRHPENSGPSSVIARKLAYELIEDLVEVHPNFAKVMSYGWQPTLDNDDEAQGEYHRLMDEITQAIDLR